MTAGTVRVTPVAFVLFVFAAGCSTSEPSSAPEALPDAAPSASADAAFVDPCAPDAAPADASGERVVGSCLRVTSGPTSTCAEWHRAGDLDPNPGIAKCPAPGVWSPDPCPRTSPGGACASPLDPSVACPVVVWLYTYANAGDVDAGLAELDVARRACEGVAGNTWTSL